ncbi:uncharacterized protein LOC105845503 [Hydra vulgaris]|uniref:uncharacterized protein LOC105845503 n=1 Tax=Hydra vulgaris TaxID=6087 RepID=UPI000640C45A|nr:uncharacterized protein LOC105845503 [Hydra vulgaris]XP_047141175.1 uncharacterized protein LOC105845503 [Hydra vulgaris]
MNILHSNFLSLHIMLIETKKLLRQKFLYSFKEIYNVEWADENENDFFVNGDGKEIQNSCKKVQKTSLDSKNSNEWDITLLCTILSSKLFLKKNMYSLHLIQKISSVRNRICHSPTLEITDKSFDELSNELTPLMLELGASKELVLELKNSKRFQTNKVDLDKNAKLLKESANEEFKNKNYERAIEIYTSAIVLPNLTNQELGILYRNRSLSYLKLYEKTKDAINLDCAVADAKKTCFYQPVWFKGYAQLGDIYHTINELQKAVKNYEKALAFSTNNDEVKNSLASLKVKLGEQYRQEHLIKLPLSTEEQEDQFLMQFRKYFPNSKNLNTYYSEMKNFFIKADPILKDVWTGHEYRDGSKNVKQNYEIAAKYYSKAAQSNNAEGMYNLACLMMGGSGVKVDFKAALSLLNEAAKQKPTRKLMGKEIPNVGVKEAEHRLGLAYQEGTYVPKNEVIASKWYHLAVQHGCSQSANNLGLMYFHGYGVPKNIKQSKKLFTFAHENGDVNASSNLVNLYLQEFDADRALVWHEIAIQKSYFSKMQDGNIREKIESIKKIQNIKDFNEVFLPIKKYLQHFENSLFVPSAVLHKASKFNIEELCLNSKNGSITASQMLKAFYLFYGALDMLKNKSFNEEDFLGMLATAFVTCQIICLMPKNIEADVLKIVNSIIQKNNNQKSEIDYFARICFAYLNCGDYNLLINFLTSSLKIYPSDGEMLHLLGCSYSFLHQYKNALKVFELACSTDPSNYEYVYSKAVVLRLLENSDAKQFYEKFISIAPADHRKIPESYYSIGLCFFKQDQDSFKNSSIITFYYNKGLENENLQLSCFLPYESNSKVCIETFLNVFKLETKKLTESLPKIIEPINKSNNIFVDYKRKETIVNHRKMFDMVKGIKNKHLIYKKITFKPLQTQIVPTSVIGLKKVFFEDIDFTKDYLLTGCVLTVTNIDIPIVGLFTSVHFVVEDENEIVVKLCIYNLGEDYQLINNMFPVGCIFSVIDPYVRLAVDGKPMIRVDDPNSIIMSEKIKIDMCLYCSKEKSKYTCSKCKVAKYCTKECQCNDWKLLKHKSACNFLSCKQ